MDSNFKSVIVRVEKFSSELGFSSHIWEDSDRSYVALSRAHTTLHLGVNNGCLTPLYVYLRACEEGGRRTDLNDCESTLLATFLRGTSIASCSLWDEPHPVFDFQEEIYGRILTFDQFHLSQCKSVDDGSHNVERLIKAIHAFNSVLPSYLDWTPVDPESDCDDHFSYDGPNGWAKEASKATAEPLDSRVTYWNARTNPTWKYYRSIKKRMAIFHSPGLSDFISEAADGMGNSEIIDGINGKMFVSDWTKNIISFKNIRAAKNTLAKLNGDKSARKKIALVPLENRFVSSQGEYALFLDRDCGRKRFEQERERIKKRHGKESLILFPITTFVWNERISDDEFEMMILDLLKQEKGVQWIRRASVSKERDGGKDLIAEWATPPVTGQVIKEGNNPFTVRRVIVQCKASKRSVGKSQVQDIRDTIEHHNAQGYFLVVSSQVATSLTDHLLALKDGGKYWIDWWTRGEIEDRLTGHPDIVSGYPNIVTVRR
jgi:hypothetical protein